MSKTVIIPIAIVGLIVLAYATVNAYRVPTLQAQLVEQAPDVVRTVEYVVDGLKCRGTAVGFTRMIATVPGVVGVTVHARTHSAIVEYDPSLTDPEEISGAFTAPIVRDGQSFSVFRLASQRDLD
jgi:copper chaperone CopZ